MREMRDEGQQRWESGPGRFACEALGPGQARGHKNLAGDKNRGQQKVSGPK